MENADHLLDRLRRAVYILGNPSGTTNAANSATHYLIKQPSAILTTNGTAIDPCEAEREARAVLSTVRFAINEFRDSRWEGIMRARNQLRETVTVTWLVTYLLLSVLILWAVPHQGLMAGSLYFLIGAIVGLFSRLRRASSTDVTLEEDFGLSGVRLMQIPLYSGLAAVAGVILTAMLPGFVANPAAAIVPQATTPTPTATTTRIMSATPTIIATSPLTTTVTTATRTPTVLRLTPTETITPTGIAGTEQVTPTITSTPAGVSTTPSSAPPPPELPSLGDIFNLEQNRFALIIAALFGLTPALLVTTLQKKIDEYKSDLKSTEGPESEANK